MLRRLNSFLLVLLLLCSAAMPVFADGTMQLGSMYVNTSNGKALRFRSSKSTSEDNVLYEIPYGTKVYVLSWDGTWARIRFNSAVGYVVKKHLSIARPEPFEAVQAQRAQAEAARKQEHELKSQNSRLDHSKVKAVIIYDVTVRTGVSELSASVYKEPSLLSDVVTTYREGTRLEVTAANKDWAKVYHGGTEQVGYMLLEELEKDVVEEVILEDE